MDALPIVDFATLGANEAADRALAQQLDAIFRGMGFCGFCYFRNIGVGQDLVDGLFAASARFHAQDEAAELLRVADADARGRRKRSTHRHRGARPQPMARPAPTPPMHRGLRRCATAII